MRPCRSYIEDHIHLNINKLSKKIQKHPINLTWGWELPSKQTASVRITLSENSVTLNYKCRSGDDWQPIQQHIKLSTTPCHLGGRRYWFHCPQCERRVRCLIQAQSLFVCRHCSRLNYRCQSESIMDRLIRKQSKIEIKVFDGSINKKKKWIHYKTYHKFQSLYHDIEQHLLDVYLNRSY